MNRAKHLLSFLTVAVFLFLALASSGVKHMTFTKEGGQIPPAFGDTTQTLLVFKTSMFGDYNSHVRKAFRRSYKGKYLIIKEKELPNYPIDQYRFTFQLADVPSNYMVQSSATGMYKQGPGTIQCIIVDRATDLSYRTANTAMYGKLLKAFVPELSKHLLGGSGE
jgi:hypothetical protein